MKKICFKLLVIAFAIVLVLNTIFVVATAFVFEKEVTSSPNKMEFSNIFNYNSDENIDDYYLLNWAYSKDDCVSCSELPQEVIKANLTRLTRTENILINFLQTKNNSIVQIKPYNVDTNHEAFVNCVEVIEIGDSFYVIIGFSEYIDDSWELTSAVYKSEDDLSELYEYETDKSRYYFYEFYPNKLAPLFSSTFAKILNVLFVIGEVALVYIVFYKIKKKVRKS